MMNKIGVLFLICFLANTTFSSALPSEHDVLKPGRLQNDAGIKVITSLARGKDLDTGMKPSGILDTLT